MKKLLLSGIMSAIMAVGLISSVSAPSQADAAETQQYYQIKIFRINGALQEKQLENFLKDAYLPALHRAGIPKVGVFKPVESDTAFGKLIYIFIPYETIEEFTSLPGKLANDKIFQKAGMNFIDAPYDDPPYSRQESILLKAFTHMPRFRPASYTNSPSQRIYELRSYESATEAKAAKKIEMFNEGGELKLFENLGFNAVFYGEVLMGSHMPNLMYMTTFHDMKTHDARWDAFRNSPEWKKMSALEQYENTVSKVNVFLLHPAEYSDF